jgi:transcription elongation factor GreB
VAWAASNGYRSENGDYITQETLREIDRRIRFLIRRLDLAEVVDPVTRRDDDSVDQVLFRRHRHRPWRQRRRAHGEHRRCDEIDTRADSISWVSPMARALLKP